MPVTFYQPFFVIVTTLMSYFVGIRYINSPGYVLQEEHNSSLLPSILCFALALWLGLRPNDIMYFGDSMAYASIFRNLSYTHVEIDWSSEWIWDLFTLTCNRAGLSVTMYFTIIEFVYVFSVFWVVKKLMGSHTLLAMLFVWTSLMYYSFGINGLRNGVACHILLISIYFMLKDKLWPSIFIFLIAFGIHRSVILPYASLLATIYTIKDPKIAVYIWLAAIPISLIAGGWFQNYFANMGFDDRMSKYSNDNDDMGGLYDSRFRWDFIIFSASATAMVWYVCVKRAVSDKIYNIIGSTYCIANAFWILIIRAPFSNRFAYLSWFLMPFVIAYPLINLAVWDDQDKKIGLILIAYSSFTLLMQIIWGFQ